jgi:hypothetical protein
MAYVVMEKLDEMTPAYALRDFNHRQQALWEILRLEKERDDDRYPQWSIIVARMEKDYPLS